MKSAPLSVPSTERAFRNPPGTFRPVPWWTWAGDMNEQEMDRQLKEMKQKGINEFFIFPIYGLEVPYLSEAWWRAVDFTLRRCQKLGMKVWIYDDYNGPSGVCGGYLLRDMPWVRNWGMNYAAREVAPGAEVAMDYIGELVEAKVVSADGQAASPSNLSWEIADGKNRIRWRNATGKKVVLALFFKSLWRGAFTYAWGATWSLGQQAEGYLDNLNPDVVKMFLRYTHDEYHARFAKYFGKTLIGFFTDEPHITYSHLPVTATLFDQFQARYGYDLRKKIHELCLDAGSYLRTRYDYWALVTDLNATSFYKQTRQWCDRHHVLYTGHLLGEETLLGNIRYSGDMYECAKWLSVPGLDLLQNRTGLDSPEQMRGIYGRNLDPRGFNVTAKLIASTARFAGAKRVMCEAFGVDDWSFSLEVMKRSTDWLCAMGVNLINDNLLPFTVKGFVKAKISAKAFTTPWWKYYGRYADYCGRLCQMTTEGALRARVAVLFPTTAMWCLDNLGVNVPKVADALPTLHGLGDAKDWPVMQEMLWRTLDAPLRRHWCFELAFDNVLASAKVVGRRLRCPNAEFEALVLPATTVVRRDVFEKIEQFAAKGGMVALLPPLPKLSPDKGWQVPKRVAQLLSQPNVAAFEASLTPAQLEDKLNQFLTAKLRKEADVLGEGSREVIMSHRRSDELDWVFVSNMSERVADVKVRIGLSGELESWSLETGEMAEVVADVAQASSPDSWDGYACATRDVPLVLAPRESALLVARRGRPPASRKLPEFRPIPGRNVIEQLLPDEWDFGTVEPNLLLLDVEIRYDDKGVGLEQGWQADTTAVNWKKVVDGRTDRPLDPDEMAFYWLRSEVDFTRLPDELHLALDSAEAGEPWVNGVKLEDPENFVLWDRENVRHSIRSVVKPGLNTITLRCKPSKFFKKSVRGPSTVPANLLDPVCIAGRFAVKRNGDVQQVIAEPGRIRSGSWHEQFYPNFTGMAVYRQEFTVDSPAARMWLDLGEVKDVAEVWVNGKLAGVRPWPPFRVELTGLVNAGRNLLEVKVTSGFGNLFRACYSGVKAEPTSYGLLTGCRLLIAK